MDDLLEQFLLEGRDLVAQAHAALVALGREGEDRDALDSLFRAAHTLKGSVALFDMAPAEQLLHAAEARLEAARKRHILLDEAALDALVAVIDQTDRWIDAMETAGRLDQDAAERAAGLARSLEGEEHARAAAPGRSAEESDWIADLRARPEFRQIDAQTARTAFRYMPDADCFFRGEDPLATAGGVPDLLALAVLPAGGEWPALETCEPFRCMAVIEGLSGADEAAVRAAFRLVPDQVLVEAIGPALAPDTAAQPEIGATLRVEAARLDQLADQSGELAVAIRSLKPIAERLRSLDPALAAELSTAEEQISRVADEVRRSVAQVRLVSLEPVLRRLPRLAREAAAGLGKAVRFTLEGEHVRADKQMADQLFEPLLHLVRNAVDHGIEAAEERGASGKPGEGQIRLSVQQDGAYVMILLADDGRGIDPARMREAAVAKGLIGGEAAGSLSDAAALQLVFLPGFSTANSATSLSGRGVGMDAVKTAVDRLAGTITIESEAGIGTRVRLRLPATAITTPLLLVRAGDQQLGIRLDQIAETARIEAAAIHPVGHARACVWRDQTVPVLDLGSVLGLAPALDSIARLIVTDTGPCRTALRVAHFGERFDAVVREGTGLIAAMPAVAGTTILADGSVLLVLDLAELVA
nr:chemotaxis protein CheA [Sphingobium bisphenolivorans]